MIENVSPESRMNDLLAERSEDGLHNPDKAQARKQIPGQPMPSPQPAEPIGVLQILAASVCRLDRAGPD